MLRLIYATLFVLCLLVVPFTVHRIAAYSSISASGVETQAPTSTTDLTPLPNIGQIVSGDRHVCVLTAGGGVQCWGSNNYGQLGDGTQTDHALPMTVVGLAQGVKQLDASDDQTCALMNSGGVKCWGGSSSDGDGAQQLKPASLHAPQATQTITNVLPIDIQGLHTPITAIAVGQTHVCALSSAGGVQCWSNGDAYASSSVVTSTTPVDLPGLTSGIKALVSGSDHICALTTGGGVKCFGYNYYGQLGNGGNSSVVTPTDVVGLTNGVVALSAGAYHTCAVLSNGSLKCWGGNFSGQLGDGSKTNRYAPVDVVDLSTGVSGVTAGYNHTCAVLTSGAAKCWGNNSSGELGDSTTDLHTTPGNVVTLNRNVTQITAGGAFTCALLNSGAVKCWGSNSSGQLGNGTDSTRTTLSPVVGLSSGIAEIAAGGYVSCAVTNGGGAKCWGYNYYGTLGDGTTIMRPAPVDVSGLSGPVSKIATSGNHTCALLTSGGVQCWGYNYYGQLGNNTTTDQLLPVDVTGLASGVVQIVAGYTHSCALLNTGGVKCWGSNYSGQLGDNTTINRATPVDVFGLTAGVKAITASNSHTCALLNGGGVRCWGYNGYGQLGDGTTTSRIAPVDVATLSSGVSDASAGNAHTCAVKTTGAVQCWGYNGYGQLGDGTTTSRLVPTNVSGLNSNAVNIATTGYHTCTIMRSGGVKCWGYNADGQLGNGTKTSSLTPVDVVGLGAPAAETATALRLGSYHSCIRTNGSAVKCWGANFYGQLGDSSAWRTVPDDVLTPCRTLTLAHIGAGNDPGVTPANSVGCSAGAYVSGEVLAVTAAPASTWQVAGWRGTLHDEAAVLTNTVIMPDGNHSVIVTYGQGCYTLTLTHTGSGSDPVATPSHSATCPDHQYVASENITVNTTPAANWAVSAWTGTANDASTAPNNTLVMPARNQTVSVIYYQPCYILTLLHSGAGDDPTPAPANSAPCPVGQFVSAETIHLTAHPADGWAVSGWEGANETTTSVSNTWSMAASNHTVSVIYSQSPNTQTPSGADAYEDDDTCERASALTPDGNIRDYTFHKIGDADWARFETVAGSSYRIEIKVPPGSPADVNLELYAQCQNAANTSFAATFAPGVRLDYTAPSNGSVFLRMKHTDSKIAGPQVTYQLSVRKLQTDIATGALILVAGRLKNPDAVQKNIHNVTQAVYAHYLNNGYTPDNIQYLATDTSLNGYDAPATLDNLQAAIVTWAASKVSANRPLILYLMDHGDEDKFYLDGVTQQILTPTQLDSWLGQLETAVPGVKITVIIESCYSGSFIKSAQRISKPNRLILTSTTQSNVAYASADGAYFSDQLIASLRQGYSFPNSFRAAYVVARELTQLAQEPWLDANGNGIPNEPEDVTLATQRGLGYPDKANTDAWAPYIVHAQGPAAILNRRGAIQAEVRDNKHVRRVWAVIYPPSYRPPSNSSVLVPEALPTLVLQPQAQDQFIGEYPGFDEIGTYRIAVYAEDDDNLLAQPQVIKIQNGYQIFMPTVKR